MTTEFTKDYLRKALSLALQTVNSQFDQLNALDAATGDGDHGTAIVSTLQAAVKASEAEASLKDMLSNIAMEIMSATGGSTSSLYGSFFMGMSDGAVSEALDPSQTVAMFQAGLTMMQTMTTAKVGDKTMMDAMLPAISALTETLQSNAGASLVELFGAAAKSAKEGAERTVEYTAKFGRAKNLGERSRGSQDAGATSLALVFQAFADAL